MWGFSFKYGGIYRALIPLLLLVGLFQSHHLLAQVSSQKGWFEADYDYGCEGLTITITHTRSGAGALFYGFEGDPNNPVGGTSFEGSFNEGNTATHTYNGDGTFYVVVVDQSGSGSDADRTDVLEITVIRTISPSVEIYSCSSNTLQLIFNPANDPYDSYFVDFGDGNSIATDGNTPISHSYANSGLYDIILQGRFNNGLSCSGYEYNNFLAYDQPATPILNDIIAESETSITLEYEPLDAAFNYTLQMDEGSGFQDYVDLDPSINPQSITLTDASFNTRTEFYGFRIVAEDECQTSSVESEAGYSIAFDIVDQAVSNTFDITFSWQTTSQNFSNINLLRDGSILQSFNVEQSSGETINFNNCTGLGEFSMTSIINGVTSTSINRTPFETSPPTLTAPSQPSVELAGSTIELNFPSTDFPLGEYVLYRKDITDDFNEIFSTSANSHTDTTIPGGTAQVCYKLAYRDECGNISELSDEVCIVLSSSLSIPNAFSPNGDGINDVFKINDGIYPNFSFMIFNRWGSLIFNTTDPSLGWDGSYEGQPANGGTYHYQISFQNADNLRITKTGSFVLIR